jgi:mono/diheme cytochrome c family protein
MNKTLLLLILAITSIAAQAQKMDLKSSMERGQSIYMGQCITCHMATGEGLETVYPSLVSNKNMAKKEYLVKVILKGQRGPIAGKTFSGEMTPIALSDQDMADVLNYVRNNFGNKAPVVFPKDIQPALKAPVKGFQAY